MTRIPDLIVTRHPGAIAWLAANLPRLPGSPEWFVTLTGLHAAVPYWDDIDFPSGVLRTIPVKAEVTAEDVRGKHVFGNLPLHLAAVCASVTVIEFAGPPPRGAEYTTDQMTAAGARLVGYTVSAI